MGKGANNGDSRRINVRVTPQVGSYLEGLAQVGVLGGSATEVARHLIENEVERMIRDRLLERALETQSALQVLFSAKRGS